MNAREAFDAVASEGLREIGTKLPTSNARAYIQRKIQDGTAPAHWLPGRLVMRQPPEVREALARLRAEDIRDRNDVAGPLTQWCPG